MEQLTKYCFDTRIINGIKTYLVSQELMDTFLLDTQLLTALFSSADSIRFMINKAKDNPERIFFAFTQHNVKVEKLVWQPVNCYKDGDDYHHVYIRDTWMCRECAHSNQGEFVKPVIELDTGFYLGADNKYPPVPDVFKRRYCDNCGKPLQGYFVSLTGE